MMIGKESVSACSTEESESESSFPRSDTAGNPKASWLKEESVEWIPESCHDQPQVGPGQIGGMRQKSGSSKRILLKRMPSKMVRSGFLDDEDSFKPNQIQKTQFLDIIDREVQRKPQKECMRGLKKANSMRIYGSKNGFTAKSVRFAVRSETDKVWCLVRKYEKEPASRIAELWWTDEDKHQTREMEVDEDDEMRFRGALVHAYDTAKYDGQVDFPFSKYAASSELRGLESDFCGRIGKFVKMHRQAVLGAQSLIKEEDDYDGCFKESERKVLQMQSVQFSTPCQLMARKMAEHDHKILTQLATLDTSSLYGSSRMDSDVFSLDD